MKYSHTLISLFLSSLLVTACGGDGKKKPPKVNAAPQATQTVFTTQAETSYAGKLAGTDADLDSLSFAVVTAPMQGVLTLQADGSFTYMPNADVTGTDKFSFTVSDSKAVSAVAEVNITIDLLQVSFSQYSRKAFGQSDATTPVALDSRNMNQDVSDETAYDDLLIP
jgi:VCBS repeat-containing protein